MIGRLGIPIGLVVGAAAAGAVGAVALTTFQVPPAVTVQRGFRGTGMDLVYNEKALDASFAAAQAQLPEVLDPAADDGPRASEVFQNVQVLGNVSAAQFGRVMQAMTNWVAPEDKVANGGCNYCHNPENMASDAIYTKVVARRMLQMVKDINSQWSTHVHATGVTCYTCHRGNPVPAYNWTESPPSAGNRVMGQAEDPAGKNIASPAAGLASLPTDPFTPFLLEDANIRVAGRTPLPEGNRQSIKQTEWTYALMMHFSQSMGANCTFCHNSRNFSGWEESSPQRVVAWYGIRMVRDVNGNYITPLQPHFPPYRLGVMGDPAKVNCMTCHQGANKPLYGAQMLKDYPELNLVTLQETTPKP